MLEIYLSIDSPETMNLLIFLNWKQLLDNCMVCRYQILCNEYLLRVSFQQFLATNTRFLS